jgi:PAS domain S-box-containing protein
MNAWTSRLRGNSVFWTLVFFALCLLGMGTADIYMTRSMLLTEKRLNIRNLVESAHGVVAHFYALQQAGTLGEADAQATALATLRQMRYGGGAYFWVNDTGVPEARMLMHPLVPELEGQVINSDEAPGHVSTFQAGLDGPIETVTQHMSMFAAIQLVVKRADQGFITYGWPKPLPGGGKTAEDYPKLSFIKKFVPWGWVIGSGIYIEDVDRALRAETARRLAISAVLLAIIFLLQHLYRRESKKLQKEIAERETVQLALQESEARYRAQVEHAMEGIIVLDVASGKFVEANAMATRMFAMSRTQLLQCSPLDLSPQQQPDGQRTIDVVSKYLAEAMAGKNLMFEWMHRDANGRIFPTEVRLVRLPSSRYQLLRGSIIDISERKQIEAELRRAYGENRAVTQAIRDNLYMLDEAGHLVWWNRQVELSTGLPAATLKGRLATEFFVPEDRARVTAAMHKAATDGYAEVEGQLITVAGPVYYQYNGVAVRDENGRYLGIAGSGRDISAMKNVETALRQLNDELEDRVARRTAEFAAARDEAERANQAKSEFLSRMSHELRTPLNAIIGFAQLLEIPDDSPLSPQQADNVHEILHAGKHLLAQVNEVLDLARIESGHLELSLETVALAPLVADCVAQVQPLAAANAIAIEVGLAPDLAVRADHLRLRQVLLNLLSNAIKYNRHGGSVRIDATPAPARLRLTVHDTGRGIPPEHLARLFRPFERLESSYEGTEGTGIGLALVKQLVEAMGGATGVASQPEVGSDFWFELPTAQLPPARPAPQEKVGAGDTVPAARAATGKTVLYIEDNPSNLKLVRKLLDSRRHLAMHDAGSAERGLELARSTQPDLILLDINLPGMDGFAALRALRADPALRAVPVVAVTANAMKRDLERCLAAGFDDYLAKPFDVAAFLQTIDRHLSGGDRRQA